MYTSGSRGYHCQGIVLYLYSLWYLGVKSWWALKPDGSCYIKLIVHCSLRYILDFVCRESVVLHLCLL